MKNSFLCKKAWLFCFFVYNLVSWDVLYISLFWWNGIDVLNWQSYEINHLLVNVWNICYWENRKENSNTILKKKSTISYLCRSYSNLKVLLAYCVNVWELERNCSEFKISMIYAYLYIRNDPDWVDLDRTLVSQSVSPSVCVIKI